MEGRRFLENLKAGTEKARRIHGERWNVNGGNVKAGKTSTSFILYLVHVSILS